MFPEEGRSAIQAAARAIADLRLGRIDVEATANVGVISGRGQRGNIVPKWCTFLAEARCHDEWRLNDIVQEMLDAFTFAATSTECEVSTTLRKTYRGYRFAKRRRRPPRRGRARALRLHGELRAFRRRRRRELVQRARPPLREPRERDDRSTRRTSTSPSPTSRAWSRSRLRSSRRLGAAWTAGRGILPRRAGRRRQGAGRPTSIGSPDVGRCSTSSCARAPPRETTAGDGIPLPGRRVRACRRRDRPGRRRLEPLQLLLKVKEPIAEEYPRLCARASWCSRTCTSPPTRR